MFTSVCDFASLQGTTRALTTLGRRIGKQFGSAGERGGRNNPHGSITGFLTFSYGVLTRTLIFSNAGREVRFQNWRLPSSSCRLSSFFYSG